MKRRQFITLLGGAAAAWPLAARAQQPERVRRIGLLSDFSEAEEQPLISAFRERLEKLGWTAANVRIDYRLASSETAAHILRRHEPSIVPKYPQLATEMMRADASLHADETRRQVGEPSFHLPA